MRPLPPARSAPRRGFTLIELLIVIVVIGLLVGMVMPRIGRGIAGRELDRVTQTLMVDLQTASQVAARNRRPVRLRAVGTTGYEVVERANTSNKVVYRNYGTGSNAGASFSGIQDTDFFPNGMTSAARSIVVTVNGTSRTVQLTLIGHVRRN